MCPAPLIKMGASQATSRKSSRDTFQVKGPRHEKPQVRSDQISLEVCRNRPCAGRQAPRFLPRQALKLFA
jgi:hypothetical protein